MNHLYFSCLDCREYVNAAYRWGYRMLVKEGDIEEGGRIDVDLVLDNEPFWNAPQDTDSQWLRERLAAIRPFLERHRQHTIVYCDRERIEAEDGAFHDWLEMGTEPEITARHLVEVMGVRDWATVEKLVRDGTIAPSWWEDIEPGIHTGLKEVMRTSKQAFERYVGAVDNRS